MEGSRGSVVAMLALLTHLFLSAVSARAATMDSPLCRAARYRAVAGHLQEYVRCRIEEPDDVQNCLNEGLAELADILAAFMPDAAVPWPPITSRRRARSMRPSMSSSRISSASRPRAHAA